MSDFLLYACLLVLGGALHAGITCLLSRRKKGIRVQSAADSSKLLQHAARQDSFFNIVLGYIPCQVFIKDPLDGFRYKIANRNFIEYYQLREENVIEHPDEDIFEPDVARQLRCNDLVVCADPGRVFRFDEDISYRRCGKEVFKSLKVCFETPDHHPYMLGVCIDITDLNGLIRIERINKEVLSQCVAESDLRKVVKVAAKTLKDELKCSRVIFLRNEEKKQLTLFHEDYAAGLSPVSLNGLEKHEKLWNAHFDRLCANELITYDDFTTIEGVDRFMLEFPDYPTKSIAGVPILVDNHLFGALLISYCEPHIFREMDKTMLRSMSRIIALAAIRDGQNRVMRLAEAENQALLDNISIPLWLYNTQGCIVQTNLAADRILGKIDHREPYDCRHLLQCKTKNVKCPVQLAMTLHKTQHEHCCFLNRNYLVEASPILDGATGSVHGVVSSFFDVSELEAAISCRQSVNDCLANIVREGDMSKAIRESIRDICEHLKATRCYIMQFEPQMESVSCFLEYSHNECAVLNRIQHRPYSKKTDWISLFMQNPLLSFPTRESMTENPGLESYRTEFAEYNVQSVFAHRILLNGKIWGYVSALYEHVPHELSSSERDYIGSIAYCIELMLIRRQYQGKIFDALRKAEDADKAKSMFLASMSHEIRTPLNAVIGFSELLRGGTLSKQTERDYLGAISDAGNALLALINDVLDLSKLEAGQMIFTPAPVDLRKLADEVGNIFLQKCHEKNLRFETEIPAGIPLVMIDKLRMRQILFNLVGNAVKFTEKGSIAVRMTYNEEKTSGSGKLVCHVSDTGIGISDDDQKRIFQMFVQGKALRGTQAERNGTGLGLAICKRMIEKMNGNLLLESTPGKGSDFIVVLNGVRRAEESTESVVSSEKKNAEEHILSHPAVVLLADDVAMNLKVLAAMLVRLGPQIRILTASNGIEALKVLEKNSVDFLLTDLWMPGMNGAELAEKIRRSGKYPSLTVAALTADVDGNENFDMSYFDAVLTKPVTQEKLKHFIGRFIKNYE